MNSIILIINTLERGGAEMSMAILANELVSKGVKVTLISLWKGNNTYDFDWIIKNGVNVLVLNKSKISVVLIYKLIKIISILNPNIVYSGMPYSNLISQICCFWLGVNHIASVRINASDFFKKNIFKKIAFNVILLFQSKIIFISRKSLNDYLVTFYGRLLSNKKLFVLHNPISVSDTITNSYLSNKIINTTKKIKNIFFSPNSVLNEQSEINFVMVSRLVDGKGIIETLSEIKLLLLNNPFRLSIYGAGPLRDSICEFISRESLGDKVFLRGFNSDVESIFANSDILIFPSRSEGFGRVPFEAMLTGNLVLCNRPVSIIGEFLNNSLMWKTYDEPLDLMHCLLEFADIDPMLCIEEVDMLKVALSPNLHALEFKKIALNAQEN
jgi:glycosyltransferase involved in cell wall biosynthesis